MNLYVGPKPVVASQPKERPAASPGEIRYALPRGDNPSLNLRERMRPDGNGNGTGFGGEEKKQRRCGGD